LTDKFILLKKLHAQFGYLTQSPSNREVADVPAYSHSNRWVGVGGACSDKWIVIGEIRGSQVTVIIVEDPFDWLSVPETRASQRQSLDALAKHNEQVKKHAESVLSRAVDAAKQAGVPCDTMQVGNARPYQAIIAAASDRGCDLIVMASHGRGGLSAVVLGSVTNKVLTHTKTPVLVYR